MRSRIAPVLLGVHWFVMLLKCLEDCGLVLCCWFAWVISWFGFWSHSYRRLGFHCLSGWSLRMHTVASLFLSLKPMGWHISCVEGQSWMEGIWWNIREYFRSINSVHLDIEAWVRTWIESRREHLKSSWFFFINHVKSIPIIIAKLQSLRGNSLTSIWKKSWLIVRKWLWWENLLNSALELQKGRIHDRIGDLERLAWAKERAQKLSWECKYLVWRGYKEREIALANLSKQGYGGCGGT